MKSNKGLIFLFLFVCSSKALHAQTDGEIEGKKFIIEKNKVIILPEFERNFEKAPFNPPVPIPIEIEFPMLMPTVVTYPQSLPIRALMLKSEPIAKLYPGEIKLGAGNYLSSLAEINFANKRNEKWAWNTYFRHRAAARGPVEFSNDSDNKVGLQGSHFTKSGTWSGAFDYSRYRYNRYGYAPELAPTSDDSITRVNQWVRSSVSHDYNNEKWMVSHSLGFSNFRLKEGSNEWLLDIQSKTSYRLSDQLLLSFKARLLQSEISDSVAMKRNLLDIQPQISYNWDKFTVVGGFRYVYDADTIKGNNGGHFYPTLDIAYILHPELATVYASLDGRMQFNSIQNNFLTLPFYADQQLPVNTNRKSEVRIGVKGSLNNSISYNGGLEHSIVQYLQTFVNGPLERSNMIWLYDSKNSNINRVFLTSSATFANKLKAVVEVNYYSYSTNELAEAWHLPTTVIKADIYFPVKDKINIQAGLVLVSGIKARQKGVEGNETAVTLGIIPDIRLQADYAVSERFGLFLQINNLLAVNYQRFQYYPVRGFQALGGVKFNF